MAVKVLSSQELVRKAVIEVANLPEPALQQVLAYIEVLKGHQTETSKAAVAAAINTEVERLVTDMQGQLRAEVMAEFRAALEAIREQAVAQGTAIDGDWQDD
jgi:hypothetical protein